MMLKSRSRKTALLKLFLIIPLGIILTLSFACSNPKDDEKVIIKEKSVQNNDKKVITNESNASKVGKSKELPEYKGGNKEIFNFIQKNIKYPDEARKKGISGTVNIKFMVDKNGKVKKAYVERGIAYGCDKEALRVVNMLDKCEPALKDGKLITAWFSIPIKFKLK